MLEVNILKKPYLKSVFVLFFVCFLVASVLTAVNYITEPVILDAKLKAETASLKNVLPDSKGFERVEIEGGLPEGVSGLYTDKGDSGYAVTLYTASQYSKENMQISVGIGKDGIIKGIEITAYYESKDFGSEYPKSFIGKDKTLSGIDTVSGVTYSSKAFISAIENAFSAIEFIKE